MKLPLIIAFVFVTSFNVVTNAQNIFKKVLFNTSANLESKIVVQTQDAGFAIAGKYHGVAHIIKLDSLGNYGWSKSFEVNGRQNEFSCVTVSGINDILVAGNIYNAAGSYYDMLCVKLNQQGDTLWTRTFPLGPNGSSYSIFSTNDQGCIVSAYSKLLDNTSGDMEVFKLDVNGNLQWSKTYHSGDWSNDGYAVKQSSDGYFYISGFTENHPSTQNPPPPPNFESNAFLMKLSPSGDIIRANRYFLQYPYAQLFATDFAFTNQGITILALAFNEYAGTFLIKVDTLGNVIKNKKYLTSSPYSSPTSTLFLKTDGKYLIAVPENIVMADTALQLTSSFQMFAFGRVTSAIETKYKNLAFLSNGPAMGVKSPPTLNPQIGIAQTDSSGWYSNACYSQSSISSYEDTLTNFLTLFTVSNGHAAETLHPIVQSTSVSLVDGCVAISGGVEENQKENLQVYPNPGSGEFYVKLTTGDALNGVEIFDMFGKRIYENQGAITSINMSAYAHGVYVLKARVGDKLYTRKLILNP